MDQQSSFGLQQFKNHVAIKFQLYNSLFTSLPFHRIEKTGILLSLLLTNCEEGYKKKMSPEEIIEDFFNRHTSYKNEQERVDLLFRFVQYVERQVVLFDALEDAAFSFGERYERNRKSQTIGERSDPGKEIQRTGIAVE